MNTEKKGAAEATPCKVLFSQLTIVVMTSEEAADVARLGSDINSLAPPEKKHHLSTRQMVFLFNEINPLRDL